MYEHNYSFNEYMRALSNSGLNGIKNIMDAAIEDNKLSCREFKKISDFAARREAQLISETN